MPPPTRRYNARNAVLGNFSPESLCGLAEGEITIANVLNDTGYDTHMIGKVGYFFERRIALLSKPRLPVASTCPLCIHAALPNYTRRPSFSGTWAIMHRITLRSAGFSPSTACLTPVTWGASTGAWRAVRPDPFKS